MWRISASARDYDWGSRTEIPAFLGIDPTGEPVAELWYGTHPLGTSTVESNGSLRPLTEVAGELPFMLKVLAPAQPLSIQVHPSSTLAELGFASEQSGGVPLTDVSRDFKDPRHKPEMVYALTTFETLLGLRPIEEIIALLEPIDLPIARSLLEHAARGRLAVVKQLLNSPPSPDEVDAFVEACAGLAERDIGRGYATVLEASRVHPSDPGVVVVLLLNRMTIEPGNAVFIGPGLMHAHLSGLCLEVMSSSDNVFRAGLTTKRVNPQGVLKSLGVTQPESPGVEAHRFGDATQVFAPAPGLFALSITSGETDLLPGDGRRILLCIEGRVELQSDGDSLELDRGQAAFVSLDDGRVGVSGAGVVAQAFVP